MKKVFSIIAVAALSVAFVACGPSAEEKAKMEENAKRIQDSIAAAINASMNAATEAASTAVDSAAAAAANAAATATDAAAKAVEEVKK
ncbi:MAG: hypothetical protein QM534_09055 [Sediminibacterium sp.]|nr:hypothetical protein [Sediminibacterium sp.]